MVGPKKARMIGIFRQPGACFFWGLDKAFFSTHVPFILCSTRAGTTTPFYLDTPYLPFLHPFCLIPFPVLDCGGD